MNQKRIANTVMVCIIVLVFLGSILCVGAVRGWFHGADPEQASIESTRGTVSLFRDGVAFTPEQGTGLQAGDVIRTGNGATVKIAAGDGYASVSENAEITVKDPKISGFSLDAAEGELFIRAPKDSLYTVAFAGKQAVLQNSTSLIMALADSPTIRVLSGTADCGVLTATAGHTIQWDGKVGTVRELTVEALDEFAISQIRIANESSPLCFSNQQLDQLEANRLAAMEQQLKEDTAVPSDAVPGPGCPVCRISIRCDTVLENMENLEPGLEEFVPRDGVILSPISVGFTEGETVFDVLLRVCKQFDIQLEYSHTPVYDSYYVEGISHLYEFSCGESSGWMYMVNGSYPDRGCSAYTVEDGDVITWNYTCVGLGADLGAPMG